MKNYQNPIQVLRNPTFPLDFEFQCVIKELLKQSEFQKN